MPFASRVRLGLVVSCAGLALAAPPAHAQTGAGDDQYADPFSGQATPTATPRATATVAPQATATPVPAAPSQSSAAPAATPAPAAAQASTAGGPTLPYTGIDAWIPGVGGALLLGGGVALRRRLRD
jgi:LPXTG-motif cell wall-anchored protein